MTVLNLDEPKTIGSIALWHLGFRPFFLGAGIWAVIAVVLWLGIYTQDFDLPLAGLAPSLWHAHEMVFGYAAAVIAGFLLTAVKNWTHVQTWNEWRLAGLVAVWAVARGVFLLGGEEHLLWAVGINSLFLTGLVVAVAQPVLSRRQWGQIPVIILPTLFLLTQLSVAALPSPRTGVFLGLFAVLLLIFIMGRRVIPFFIEKGVDAEVEVPNYPELDAACIVFYLLYVVAEIFAPTSVWTAWAAAMTGIAHGIRLLLWYKPGIWRKPLLWILWVGYGFIVFGFLLRGSSMVWATNPFLSIHALTYGGVGLITLGMMTRVALGHTGRNVFEPPRILGFIFSVLVLGAIVRVILPLVFPAAYSDLITLSQAMWVAAFLGYLIVYFPMLILPRIDGRYG